MSRIQDILNKAEREGTARRTRALSDHVAPPAPAAAPARPAPAALPRVAEAAPLTAVTPAPQTPPPIAWVDPAAAPPLDHHVVATARPQLDRHLVAATAPQSLAAEQYRLLRTRVKTAANAGRAVRTIP